MHVDLVFLVSFSGRLCGNKGSVVQWPCTRRGGRRGAPQQGWEGHLHQLGKRRHQRNQQVEKIRDSRIVGRCLISGCHFYFDKGKAIRLFQSTQRRDWTTTTIRRRRRSRGLQWPIRHRLRPSRASTTITSSRSRCWARRRTSRTSSTETPRYRRCSPQVLERFLWDVYSWCLLQHEFSLIGDHELRSLKKGDRIQLQRRGYYICDSPYQAMSRYTGRETPLVLINIPDGHTKDMPKFGSKHKEATEVTLNFKLWLNKFESSSY